MHVVIIIIVVAAIIAAIFDCSIWIVFLVALGVIVPLIFLINHSVEKDKKDFEATKDEQIAKHEKIYSQYLQEHEKQKNNAIGSNPSKTFRISENLSAFRTSDNGFLIATDKEPEKYKVDRVACDGIIVAGSAKNPPLPR